MVAGDRGLRTVKAAKQTEAKPLNRGFLASMLRRAQESLANSNRGWIKRQDIQAEIDRAYERGKADAPTDMKAAQKAVAEWKRRVEEWHAGTGIDLVSEGWRVDVARVARCYRLGQALLGERYGEDLDQLVGLLAKAEQAARSIQEQLRPLAQVSERTRTPVYLARKGADG
jgi:hypothetical protein